MLPGQITWNTMMRNVGIVQTMPSSSRRPQKLGWSACGSSSTTAMALSSSKRGSCPNRNVRIPAPRAHTPQTHPKRPTMHSNASTHSAGLELGSTAEPSERVLVSVPRDRDWQASISRVRQHLRWMLTYSGAQQADGQEGKAPALDAQRMQRAYVGRIQCACACMHACLTTLPSTR